MKFIYLLYYDGVLMGCYKKFSKAKKDGCKFYGQQIEFKNMSDFGCMRWIGQTDSDNIIYISKEKVS